MIRLFLLFNHHLTPAQEADAIENLGIETFVSPPDDITQIWGQIPPDMTGLSDYLKPVEAWLADQAAAGDYVLIQGDFGACYWMVQAAFALNLISIYATTRREAIENHLLDGSIELTHQFRHVIYRGYENYSS